MKLQTDILYVTYRHDLEWLQWSLASVKKNFSGFRKIVGVAPVQDHDVFEKIPGVEWHFIPDWPGRGYFWQQWVKLQAWKYSDADYICHVDSDVMFIAPVKLAEFFDGDLPCWMWQSYLQLPADVPWQKPTEHYSGFSCSREFMRAFPFIVNRETHQLAESRLVDKFQALAEHIIKNASAFSEFNYMGAVAFFLQNKLYSWFDTGTGVWPEAFRRVRQHWSHDDWGKAEPELVKEFGPVPVLTDFGVWVIPGDTHLSKWIREHRRLDFDIHFLERIAPLIKGDDVVADVGAFVGDHTLAYANLASSGCVYAFEPNDVTFRALVKNMAPYPHVEPIQAGLSDKCGSVQVSQDPNWGGAYLSEAKAGDSRVLTLDSMHLGRLNFMKIDAEGFEVKVLRGAWETLKRCKPALVIEINKGALRRQGTSSEVVYDILGELGYRVEEGKTGLQYDITCLPL